MQLYIWDRSKVDIAELKAPSILPENELHHAVKMGSKERQADFLSGRFLLRKILLQENGIELPELIGANKHGKPEVAELNSHFNISHSNGYTVLAIDEKPVGVDVQSDDGRNISHIIEKYANKSEKAELAKMNEIEQREHFFKIWSLKESYAKWLGTGLFKDLMKLDMAEVKTNFFSIKIGEHYISTCYTSKSYNAFQAQLIENGSFRLQSFECANLVQT